MDRDRTPKPDDALPPADTAHDPRDARHKPEPQKAPARAEDEGDLFDDVPV